MQIIEVKIYYPHPPFGHLLPAKGEGKSSLSFTGRG